MAKSELNLAKKREQQINELTSWGEKNTDLKKFSNNEVAKFFFSDRENIPNELVHVSKTFNQLKTHAIEVFNVGNYVGAEYAMSIILKLTKDTDFVKTLNKIQIDSTLIQPPLTNSGKFKLIQKIITEINDEDLPSNEKNVIERLTQKEGFTEIIAKETIEKALKIGAITKNASSELSL